ncbi:hypothetical protein ACO0M4_27330 [Streptomyces sp. RGM 3693]|uniref:hypothetical protein n=1 Tax=Streptomyces sp. RGM 3693 TaxID=3413284 RepID=UPI003D2A67A1
MSDVTVVGVVAVAGGLLQSGERRGQLLRGVEDGVVEAEGEFEGGAQGDNTGYLDLGAQDAGAVIDTLRTGGADEGGDLGGEGGGAQVKAVEQLLGEGDLVVGPSGVGECSSQGQVGLGGGTFAGDTVVLGLGACRRVGGQGLVDRAVGPPQVAHDAVMSAFPAQTVDSVEGGGEVAGDAGEMGQAAEGCGGQAAAAVGDVLHPAPGGSGLAEVAVGLGAVVGGHVRQVLGQQTGGEDGSEAVGGATAVFVLTPGQGAQKFDEGLRGGPHGSVGGVLARGWREGFPDGVADVSSCWRTEPGDGVFAS